MPQGRQGLRIAVGMMPEIVDDLDAACFAAHFLPPRDALENSPAPSRIFSSGTP